MKHLITRTLTSLALAVVALAMTVPARAASAIKVNIPFEFDFGKQTFPAGEYTLVQPLQHFLVLRDAQGRAIASTFTGGIDSSTPVSAATLKFQYAGGRHILAEVWQQEDTSGELLFPAKSRTNVAAHRSPEAREAAEGSQP
jgi:hypothetical protein